MTETALISQLHDAMVIGAGAAGVGVAVTLHHAGVNDFYVLDRDIFQRRHLEVGRVKRDHNGSYVQ